MKSRLTRIFLALALTPLSAFAANSVVNMSHYDLMRPDFVAMKSEGVVGVIHEASFPRNERDWRYAERQLQAMRAGLLWGAYHFADGTDPIRQADHFLSVVASSHPLVTTPVQQEKERPGVLLVLDFEKNHYRGGNMSVSQAVAFAQRIKERTGKYPGIYGSENRLRQMFSGIGGAQAAVLSNCWLWVANYHVALGRQLSRATARHLALGPVAHVAIYRRREMRSSSAQRFPGRRGEHAQGRAKYF
jgi:lysozyme